MKRYTKEQFLKAAELGEVSMIDANHIVSLLDEVNQERDHSKDIYGPGNDNYGRDKQPLFDKDSVLIKVLNNAECVNCRFNKSESYHDKMWCRDCRQKSHFESVKQEVNPEPVTVKSVKNCYSPCIGPDCEGCNKFLEQPELKSAEEIREILIAFASRNDKYQTTNVRNTEVPAFLQLLRKGHETSVDDFLKKYSLPAKQSVSDEERRLKILEEVKIGFDICSDMSTFCLGYRNLVKEIEGLASKITNK